VPVRRGMRQIVRRAGVVCVSERRPIECGGGRWEEVSRRGLPAVVRVGQAQASAYMGLARPS
jgi:hypothetical protein